VVRTSSEQQQLEKELYGFLICGDSEGKKELYGFLICGDSEGKKEIFDSPVDSV
jgi:hypothetical protein